MNGDEPIVYVVDDDEGSRDSVRALVRSMGVRAETFESAQEFLGQFDPRQPGCLVTDVRMLGMSGIELQEKLADDGVNLPVIIITAHAETPLTVRAVKRGAVTVLEKPCRHYELFDAIRDGLARDTQTRLQAAELQVLHGRMESLLPQEQEVLELMLEGAPNKVIANRLDVSVRTVEYRRQRIFEKSGAETLAELIRLVMKLRSGLDS